MKKTRWVPWMFCPLHGKSPKEWYETVSRVNSKLIKHFILSIPHVHQSSLFFTFLSSIHYMAALLALLLILVSFSISHFISYSILHPLSYSCLFLHASLALLPNIPFTSSALLPIPFAISVLLPFLPVAFHSAFFCPIAINSLSLVLLPTIQFSTPCFTVIPIPLSLFYSPFHICIL